MGIIALIARPIIIFSLVGSFSLFFASFFLVAGVLTTKIQRNIREDNSEIKNLKGYLVMFTGGLIGGLMSLAAMVLLQS